MADDKLPLAASVNGGRGEAVDYEALFSREGDHRRHSERFATKTAIGEFRNPKRFYWYEWVFLVVATLSMLAVIGISTERFDFFQKSFLNISLIESNETDGSLEFAQCNSWVCISDFIFAVALLVNLGFCAFYCYDGLFRERPFEILAYVVAVIVIIVYTIGNFAFQFTRGTPEGGERILKIVRLVVVLLVGPLNILLAMMSWWKMGFLVFTIIGANKTLVWTYRCRSFLLTLQWFSLQVLANIFVLAWSRDGQMLGLPEKIILPILTVYMFLLIILGAVAVLWELHAVSYVWYAVVLPYAAYCIYRMIEVFLHWSDYEEEYDVYDKQGGHVTSSFKYVGAALLIACIVGVIVSVLLVVFMAISQKHFGQGLKEKIPPPFSKKTNK